MNMEPIPSTQPCELIIILDRSQSMTPIWSESVSGLQALVNDYRESAPHAKLTISLFSTHDHMDTPYKSVPMAEINTPRSILGRPDGMTAMNDAICDTLDACGIRFAGYPKEVRDNLRVVCVIITDGHENDSKRFNSFDVKKRIQQQESQYSWQFQFLGANINAIEAADRIGINPLRAANFAATEQGAAQVFRKSSEKARMYGASGQSAACNYTTEDRNDLVGGVQ